MWRCKKCGEAFEENTAVCWSCGTARRDAPSFEVKRKNVRTYVYRWKINGVEYKGSREFGDEAGLRGHIKKIGGELLEIIEVKRYP